MDLGRGGFRERGRQGRGGRRFACVDPSPRSFRLDRRRNARAQPTAAERDDDRVGIGQVLEDLQPDRAVPRHHRRIRERMDERPPFERRVRPADADLPDLVPRELNDRRPEPPDRGELRRRRGVRDDRGARDSEPSRMPREGLGHVAGAAREHAVTSLFRRQEGDRIACTPDLERPGRLQVLQLQVDLRRRIVDIQADERRPDDQAFDALSGGLDGREVEHVLHARPQGAAGEADAGDDEPNRYPPKAVPQTKIGQTIIRSIPPGPRPRYAFAMYNPSATSDRTPRMTEMYRKGGRTIRAARIAESPMKINVQRETSSWTTPKASVNTPTAMAPAPASATTIDKIRSPTARQRNQAVARTRTPTRMIEGLKTRAAGPTPRSLM